jgi:hypothetical protein
MEEQVPEKGKQPLFDKVEKALGFPQEKAAQVRDVIESLPARDLKWILESFAKNDRAQGIERFKKCLSLSKEEADELFKE